MKQLIRQERSIAAPTERKIPYGTDGYAPRYDPEGDWAQYNKKNIYFGLEGLNKIVPKVDDLIHDTVRRTVEIVVEVDQFSFIPRLEAYGFRSTEITEQVRSSMDANYLLIYDTSQYPYILTPEVTAYIFSTEATYARIYKGSTTNDANIISQMYNQSGDFIGHDVPIEIFNKNSHDSDGTGINAVRNITSCYTNQELVDGEYCTINLYGKRNNYLGYIKALVHKSTFHSASHAQDKYVVDIYMKCPWISDTNRRRIDYPIDLPIKSFNPIGVVVYSNGDEVEHVVNQGKFRLVGLQAVTKRGSDAFTNSFAATTIGHKVKCVLQYELSKEEKALGELTINNDIISQSYDLFVSDPSRSHNVKLFSYPEWIGEKEGYRLRHFLTNLDRNDPREVTPYVYISDTSAAFDPVKYNTTQRLILMLQLDAIEASVESFLYSQEIEVILRGKPTERAVKNIWEVTTQYPTTTGYYGTNTYASLAYNRKNVVNISNGCETVKEFLDKTYYLTDPLVDRQTEVEPPVPTHISIQSGNENVLLRIEDFQKDIIFQNELELHKNVDIVFYLEQYQKYLALSIASMTIREYGV